MTKPTLLINTYIANWCSAGNLTMHYLAALLRAAGVPVATTGLCLFDPTIPVRPGALPEDIVVYPDASVGNPNGGKRVAHYMLFVVKRWNDEQHGKIPKDQCVIVYHGDFLNNVARHYEGTLTRDDVIMVPICDPRWCFAEEKTIENIWYDGKRTDGESTVSAKMPDGFKVLPSPVEPQSCDSLYSDSWHAHQRTLALLRRTKNFYTCDHFTMLSLEAALCGCQVIFVQPDGSYRPLHRSELMRGAGSHMMCPEEDVKTAQRFADRIYQFFNC